ncbi:sorbose reductase [Marinomonas agarivorans]|nr:sorbose reductase [Marinomonas agarivorans]
MLGGTMNNALEYHVASFIAHAKPEHSSMLAKAISEIEGAEIHAISPEGKIVFTIEADTQRHIANRVEHIQYRDELLSLSPVYHQFLNEEQLH